MYHGSKNNCPSFFIMAIKILEIDIAEELLPIEVTGGYDEYRLLVRIGRQPAGWITVTAKGASVITPSQLHKLIQHKLSWQVKQHGLAAYLASAAGGAGNNAGPFISVVVCTRDRTAQLAVCLQSLLAVQYTNFEIIVVDNTPSGTATFNLVKNLNVRYVCENRPGLNNARNRGIEAARYDIIAFTDDDVCVDRYWLQAIAKAFTNEEVMAVTGYVAPAELATTAQSIFELDYGGMGQGFNQRIIRQHNLSAKQLIWASNFGIGANMSFRRGVFSKTGGFDPALDVGTPSGGGGDIEMFHRLVSKGFTLVYDPCVIVWHTHRKDMPGLKKQIFNNGRGFGCYLISSVNKGSVKSSAALKFLLINWFYKWNLRNLLKSKIPKQLSLAELYGMLTSPAAYKKSQAYAKEQAALK